MYLNKIRIKFSENPLDHPDLHMSYSSAMKLAGSEVRTYLVTGEEFGDCWFARDALGRSHALLRV